MNHTASKSKFLSVYRRSTSSEFQGGRIPMKGISFGIVMLLCFVLLASLQSAEPWKPLFNGKDFTNWTVPARGGAPSLSPADAGWKMEDGIIVGGRAGPGQKGGSLVSQARFKDFELELDFMLAEQPAAPDGSCTTCT